MEDLILFIYLATLWICTSGAGIPKIPGSPLTSDRNCLARFGIFPDPSNCKAFYECSYGRAYRKECPNHTGFDEHYSVCVHSYDVECGGRGGIYGTLSPPFYRHLVKDVVKEEVKDVVKDVVQVTETPSAIDFHCLKEYGRVADLDNCRGFYECTKGHALWKKCPNGTAFDEKRVVCVHPSFVECNGRGGIYGTLVPLGTNFKKTSMSKDKQCPRKFGIFPDPDDCQGFYECSYGIAKKKECPPLTAFEERLSVCGHVDDVNCGGRGGIYGSLPAPIHPQYPN